MPLQSQTRKRKVTALKLWENSCQNMWKISNCDLNSHDFIVQCVGFKSAEDTTVFKLINHGEVIVLCKKTKRGK